MLVLYYGGAGIHLFLYRNFIYSINSIPKCIILIVTDFHNYEPFKQKKSKLNHRISELEEALEMHH